MSDRSDRNWARFAVAVAISALAVGLSAAFTDSKSSVGETSCTRLVHDWLHQAAEGNFEIVSEQLQACHQDGDKAVARVNLRIRETVFDPFAGVFRHRTRKLTVVVKLAKSPWQVTDAKVAS